MKEYTVKLNGEVYGTARKDIAEEVAEKLWSQGRGETQVLDPDGNIIQEFEV